MKVLFQPGLSGEAWPGVLDGREAAFGEAWVGEAGLLGLLETQLGLGGPAKSDLLRAAALLPVLREQEGFWSRSLEVDPLGVGLALVRRWDVLRLHGWDGQPVSSRLKELHDVCKELPSGMPDRLREVTRALKKRSPGIERVLIPETSRGLPALWQELRKALEGTGTAVCGQLLYESPAEGDLLAARGEDFRPEGDGRLQLVRAAGPLQAADDLAAWLAAQDDLGDTVIVTPDHVLDSALHRHGLPTSGSASPHQNLVAQVLPLVLETGWSPADPARVLELLMLPVGPVPRRIAWKLAKALQEWPALGSPGWCEAWRESLEQVEEDRRSKIEERLGVLLKPTVTGDKYPAAEVERRTRAVLSWLRGRRAMENGDWSPWNQAVEQCETLLEVLDLSGPASLSRPILHRFVADAGHSADASATHEAQTGLCFIDSPSALLGRVGTLVWWNFVRDSAEVPEDLQLWPAEVEALEAAGIKIPDPGDQARLIAERWRWCLSQTRERLLLIYPERDSQDQEQFPHPLWDEIIGAVPSGVSVGPLVTRTPRSGARVSLTRRKKMSMPMPRREWTVAPEAMPSRDHESPSSLGSLLGCSFRYCLQYGARVRPGASASLASGTQLWGSLVHHVLEQVFKEGALPSPKAAAALAADVFDRDVPLLASGLVQAGEEANLALVRGAAVNSARELTRQLKEAGLDVTGMEMELKGKVKEGRLKGYVDMLAGPSPAIIDLKWGGGSYHGRNLKEGTAFQLATYSRLKRSKTKGGKYPPMAYFILSEQRLLTTDQDRFKAAELVEGPAPQETWEALSQGWKEAWRR